jgi:hypothetical protein
LSPSTSPLTFFCPAFPTSALQFPRASSALSLGFVGRRGVLRWS